MKGQNSKNFVISLKVTKNILNRFKELLEKEKKNSRDCFHLECIEQLQKLKFKNLQEILEKVFYSSLEKEEGQQHHFSVIISPPENKFNKLLRGHSHKHNVGYFYDVSSFETPININLLHKISPAFEFTDKKLRLWFDSKNEIKIWGFANDYFNNTCIEIKTFSPGQLIIYIFSSEYPLERYLMTFSRTECIGSDFSLPKLLFNDDEFKKASDPSDREIWLRNHRSIRRKHGLFVDLINKIRSHAHGGILLIIPDQFAQNVLKESVKAPIPFNQSVKYDAISRKLNREQNEYILSQTTRDSHSNLPWSFDKEIDFLGQITAIDGATIITKNFDVIAFGAKIKSKEPKENEDILEYVWIKEPFENFKEHQQKVSDLGGTRHQSAAQFVFDQRERSVFAIVSSQDGRVSIIFWDNERFWNDEKNETKKGIITVLRHAEYLFFGVKI
ncbi:MAG TPA: hypothetical protein VGB02_02535 [Pyrinomonadaceae bacterium]|jgi:hypothetical protein